MTRVLTSNLRFRRRLPWWAPQQVALRGDVAISGARPGCCRNHIMRSDGWCYQCVIQIAPDSHGLDERSRGPGGERERAGGIYTIMDRPTVAFIYNDDTSLRGAVPLPLPLFAVRRPCCSGAPLAVQS